MGSSISGERLEAKQLDAIIEAYSAMDAACGRKPDTHPLQPERLPTVYELYDLFLALAPELHHEEDVRDTLVTNTRENVNALGAGTPTFELLSYADITLCALFGVPHATVEAHLDAYNGHVKHGAIDSRFTHNIQPNHKDTPAPPLQRKPYFDLLESMSGVDRNARGKAVFDLDGKAALIQHARPLGYFPYQRMHTLALSICQRYHDYTVCPEKTPEPLRNLRWISYMAAVNSGSMLCPALEIGLAPYLVDESGFLAHPAGKCFSHNFRLGKDIIQTTQEAASEQE